MNILFFLIPKEDVMYVNDTDSVGHVLLSIRKNGFTAVPMLDQNGKYVGTITEGDLLWTFFDTKISDPKYWDHTAIGTIERKRDNQAVSVTANIEDLFEKVTNQNFVPVVDDNNVFIGIVTRKDIMVYLSKKIQEKNQ
jgi:CBS domain-containing protein